MRAQRDQLGQAVVCGAEIRVTHLARGLASVRVAVPMTSTYSAAGLDGIVDGYRGFIDYRGGDWQGFTRSRA